MQILNLTVRQYADHYIPCGTKIRVIKNFKTIFKGTLEDLLRVSDDEVNESIVAITAAQDDYLCLTCRSV